MNAKWILGIGVGVLALLQRKETCAVESGLAWPLIDAIALGILVALFLFKRILLK
jgi:hypothetical protein